MRQRFMASVVLLAMLLGILAGCGGSKPADDAANKGDAEPAAQEPITLEFWTISLSPTFDDFINGMISEYEAAHPNIKIKWVDQPYASIQDKLLTSIAAGEAPDVVNLNTVMAMTLAAKGALVDISKEGPPELKDVYFDGFWKSGEIDGGIYALPWYASGHVLIYNKQIFEEAGLDPMDPPSTWEELGEVAAQIKANTGKDGVQVEPKAELLWMAGVDILTPDRKKAAFNTPEAKAKLQWFVDLHEKGAVPADNLTKNYTHALNSYMGGQLAMVMTGPQFLNRIRENSPEIYEQTWVAPYPVDPNGRDQLPLMDLVIPKLSKHHKEAIDFAAFITNDENQLAFCKLVPILPSTKKAAADPYFSSGDMNKVEDYAKKIVVQQLSKGADFALGIGGKQSDVQAAIIREMVNAATGAKSVEQALADAEEKVNKVLAQD